MVEVEGGNVKKEMSYYQKCVQGDIVQMTMPLWRGGGGGTGKWRWRHGGETLYYPFDPQMGPHTPWRYVKPDMDCFLWNDIMFGVVKQQIGKTFVPEHCQGCYKIVARPKTLRALFALEKLQYKLDLHSKCGIEVRTYVPALYGGYWYNRGVEEGQRNYEIVRKAVDADPELGPETSVILKRSCTEMERDYGRSDQWPEVTQGQRDLEELIRNTIEYDDYYHPQPPAFVLHLHRMWIEWAFQHGDETYKDYTNGLPIKRPAVTYHDKENEDG